MEFSLFQGDVLAALKRLPDESVDCVVTSPPYWGLRDYGVDGQIGLEQSPEEYVSKLVEVFREVRRVLKKTGTCWLNLGDSYFGGGRAGKEGIQKWGGIEKSYERKYGAPTKIPNGFKPKDLCGIPWRVAFALQADGWWLRQDIIWAKPNPMPESVTDRCTNSHEYIFLLTKSQKYYFDNEAIKEPYANSFLNDKRIRKIRTQELTHKEWKDYEKTGAQNPCKTQDNILKGVGNGANKRSVWSITTKGYSGAHFATFPPELPEFCIKAGCPKAGVVLDPFLGSGTTLMVARELGRSGVGIELNPEYVKLAKKRVGWGCGLDVQFKELKEV